MRLKRILLICICCFFSSIQAARIQGRIIFRHDTLETLLKVPTYLLGGINYERLQYKLVYFDADGKRHIVRAESAREIQFTYQEENVRMLSRPNTLSGGRLLQSGKPIFLKLVADGYLKMFEFHIKQTAPIPMGVAGTMYVTVNVERYILQKGEEKLHQMKGLLFRKDMMEYLADCSDVSNKIERRELEKKDLPEIVRLYNRHCGK